MVEGNTRLTEANWPLFRLLQRKQRPTAVLNFQRSHCHPEALRAIRLAGLRIPRMSPSLDLTTSRLGVQSPSTHNHPAFSCGAGPEGFRALSNSSRGIDKRQEYTVETHLVVPESTGLSHRDACLDPLGGVLGA